MSNGNTFSLPADYEVMRTINLAKDKSINLMIQLFFIFITVVLIGFALWIGLPSSNNMNPFFSFLFTVSLVLIYMALHELTHAFFIKVFSDDVLLFRFVFLFFQSAAKLTIIEKVLSSSL
ncbi:hypothetical protein [Planococcus sp. ISL-110]|uniref:hypothetical protein n=1 Tax=Planococcus sp. ISL-110 TaxID=2819167 RepID=UPI001BE8783A|nr:hypothetical protein [Planococcus sp. ISL-110]MBT2570464.1 hypothetical protein [Planococcus sp. ISL-110]